jgi:muconolactone delta-isomerase
MQVLAIERFTKESYLDEAIKHLEEHKNDIAKLHYDGWISALWSRKDKPGNLVLMDVDSISEAKKLLSELPLVKQKILTYGVIPLEQYQLQELLPELDKQYTVLVYASAESTQMTPDKLQEILKVSRERNAKIGITGVLLYSKGSFLQVLEGKENRINSLYKKILQDKRHEKIVKITTLKSNEKIFSDWSMGYAQVSEKELESIEGLNDFFTEGKSFTNMNENQVQNILEAFKSGKWHQKIKSD